MSGITREKVKEFETWSKEQLAEYVVKLQAKAAAMGLPQLHCLMMVLYSTAGMALALKVPIEDLQKMLKALYEMRAKEQAEALKPK